MQMTFNPLLTLDAPMLRKSYHRALVVDDDPQISAIVAETLERMGLEVTCVHRADELLRGTPPDVNLLVMDLLMPGVDGIELLRALGAGSFRPGLILMSGVGARILETAEELASSLGFAIVGRLEKPFRIAELRALVDRSQKMQEPACVEMQDPQGSAEQDLDRSELDCAFDRHELVPHFQPQIDLQTGAIAGVEALVRWHHPVRGLLTPAQFLADVEASGRMPRLTWEVIDQSLAALRAIHGTTCPNLTLSINICPSCLRDVRFPDALSSLLARHGIAPAAITIEITEGGLLEDLPSTLDVLARLRMKGVCLSVDDYGTGYAMMQQLRRIPATELKIDRSFIQRLPSSTGDRVMVQKTIEMGHALGMKVVAEGIETAAQLHALQTAGCDLARGYYFSRPLPEHELTHWLQQRAAA
jgi:EAL domain-containing protein (putative c-di-GMP-specific phosphodiesterase class I)/FixJ family two-component response regulator